MTLISTPTDLSSLYNYPHSNLHSTDDNYSLAHAPALSWLQPATAPAASSKYRTLASIQAQSLHQQQQHQYSLQTLPPVSPISLKPTALDSTLAPDHSGALAKKQARQPSITAAIQQMDNSHGTCFLPWIHNPSNLDYISLRLRPLCLEYPLVDVANVLRWIGADWSSVDCKALFRAVTQSWDPARRRMLAFLLIRDEEMRQKAKSKLVEFAQKTGTRSHASVKRQPLRRPSSLQQHQQPQQQQQHRPYSFQNQQLPSQRPLQTLQSHPESDMPAVHSLSLPSSVGVNSVQDSATIDLAALEALVASAMITGQDVTLPLTTVPTTTTTIPTTIPSATTIITTTTTTTTTTTGTTGVVCASKANAISGSHYQRRYSPY
ncbi:hypothetical protein EC968_009145 [Mortierella alpina]|nr:hypothetical protein EC968_009145 [Mortierella alpina]